jgi:hypothetical protein
MYVLLGQSQVIQKVGPIGQPQWELDSMFFLYLECRALTAPTENDLNYLRIPQGGGGVSVHNLEINVTFMRLFKSNIMITLATDLVQQFYTYWRFRIIRWSWSYHLKIIW